MIRPCCPADEASLLLLWEVFDDLHFDHSPYYFRKPSREERVRRHRKYRRENGLYLIYEHEGTPAGFVCGEWRQTPDVALLAERTVLELHAICVEDRFRDKGWGKALIEAAVRQAREKQINDVEAHIWDFNSSVINMMQNLGFRSLSGKYGLTLDQSSPVPHN
jgi:GNAT superfamily N-acetyltransferase